MVDRCTLILETKVSIILNHGRRKEIVRHARMDPMAQSLKSRVLVSRPIYLKQNHLIADRGAVVLTVLFHCISCEVCGRHRGSRLAFAK